MSTHTTTPAVPEGVAARFAACPADARRRLEALRALIFDVATDTDGVGAIEETLKWGEPAYLTPTGTTIRLDWKERDPDDVALYVSCQTTLVGDYRAMFPDTFRYEGDRAVVMPIDDEPDVAALSQVIAMALRYHLDR